MALSVLFIASRGYSYNNLYMLQWALRNVLMNQYFLSRKFRCLVIAVIELRSKMHYLIRKLNCSSTGKSYTTLAESILFTVNGKY